MKQALVSSTDQGGGKRRGGTRGSGYFQAAQAKLILIHCLRARLSFILDIYGDLRRQTAELIADVPAVSRWPTPRGETFRSNVNNDGHHKRRNAQ
jgi:hypothetical protein